MKSLFFLQIGGWVTIDLLGWIQLVVIDLPKNGTPGCNAWILHEQMFGNTSNTYYPKWVVFHGDESHGAK